MATDDLLEPLLTFRPRIAGKRSEADPHRVPLLLSEMRRRLNRRRPPPARASAARRGGIAGVSEPGRLSRRCLVKSHYVPVWGAGRDAARLHLAYLERDGVERDGSPGVLYGADGEFDATGFAAVIPGEPRQFRFIVSPEDAGELDLHAFTRSLMARMAEDLGRPLIWAAVTHADILDFDSDPFDGFYIYNPFEEHLRYDPLPIDDAVEPSPDRYRMCVASTTAKLIRARPGTAAVTFNGLGGPMPHHYREVRRERFFNADLTLWIKKANVQSVGEDGSPGDRPPGREDWP
jgi:hypothetical protein